MKKIIITLLIALAPLVSFAQRASYRVVDFVSGRYGCDGFESAHSVWGGLYFLIFTPLVLLIIAISLFVFWILMLIDAIKHSPEKLKIVWVLVIIFTHIVGALIYYFIEKRPRNKHGHERHTEKIE